MFSIIVVLAIVIAIPCLIRSYRRKQMANAGSYGGSSYGTNEQAAYYGQPEVQIPVGTPVQENQQRQYEFPNQQGYRLGDQQQKEEQGTVAGGAPRNYSTGGAQQQPNAPSEPAGPPPAYTATATAGGDHAYDRQKY